jgi:hypothetical protein
MGPQELRPRLWRWTARHPGWTPEQGGEGGWEPEAGCHALVAPDGRALVLVDPLVPADDEDGFWRALDGDVERHGPPHILLTVFWHARGSRRILGRYEGARLCAYAPARESAHELAYRVPEYDAVVVGDSLIRPPGGDVRVWSHEPSVRTELRSRLAQPLGLLLLTHGEPVLGGGREALARALEA